MATKVLSTTIDEALAEKLDKLATETHRKKSYFVNQALKEYFDEIEDLEDDDRVEAQLPLEIIDLCLVLRLENPDRQVLAALRRTRAAILLGDRLLAHG